MSDTFDLMRPKDDDGLRQPSPSQDPYSNEHTTEVKEDENDGNDGNDGNDENEDGGFGGFSEALPDLSTTSRPSPPIRRDSSSDRDWGATELPPSKWDEDLHAPPTWQPSPSINEPDEVDTMGDGTSDPWRPAQARRHSSSNDNSTSIRNKRSIDIRKVSEEAELDLEKLQSELGIQIRNLDEEYASQGKNSPNLSVNTSAKSPTTSVGGGKSSRWSIWGGSAANKKSTSEESGSRRGSIDRISTTSPRSSISTAGINSAASTSAPQTPDIQSDTKQPATSAEQQQAAGVSRFFRFGKGRANSSDPSASTSITTSKQQQPPSVQTHQQQTEITDDFSQLENFDSKRSMSANGTRRGGEQSGYDDFGITNSNGKDDDEPQRKGWFWNRRPVSPGTHRALQARSKVVDYSNEQEEEQDLDKVFSAFSDAPPAASSSAGGGIARQPSLRSQGRPASAVSSSGMNTTRDPFAHLSAAASSIRSSASVDPFDPLDPLAELNQASNITARHYKDHPSPSLSSYSPSLGARVPARSPPVLHPPPSASASLAKPLSSNINIRIGNTPTPPPLLAPPPPLSSVSRKVSQPSLLDDLADLNISGGPSSSSPASGPGPIVAQAPTAIKPPSALAKNVNILEDDFGNFETFAPGSTTQVQAENKPQKANGPMKLAGSKAKDVDFFDLL